MKKNQFWALALASASLVSTVRADGFADTLITYNTGTGFAAGFTNFGVVLGSPTTGSSVTPFAAPFSKNQILSVGVGGSLVVQFNTPILNDPSHPFGLDFTIYGNSFFILSGSTTSGSVFSSTTAGSTRVSVSQDGSTFYTLDTAAAPTANILFPTDGLGDPTIPVNPALTSSSFAGQNLAGVRALYNGSAGGTSYDIAWAKDSNGDSVVLTSISFVEVDVLSSRIQVDAFSQVPEPASLSLIATSLGFLGCLCYRKIRRA